MWFDLITWPGCLTIKGDMGCWTFSRVDDMLTFFRSTPDDFVFGKLSINADYWAEKLQHGTHGGRDGAKVWDEESFKKRLTEQLTDYFGLEGDDLKVAKEALTEDVLRQDNKYDLIIAARDFAIDLPDRDAFQFDPCELPDGMEYAYHFIWCLYAIVWGIQQYDAVKVEAATCGAILISDGWE